MYMYISIFAGKPWYGSLNSISIAADRIAVSWTAPEFVPTGYTLTIACSLLCDNTSLPHPPTSIGPTEQSTIITGLIPGSVYSFTLTAHYGDIINETLMTEVNNTFERKW